MGAGVGAVYTVTLPPPPCGTSAIDSTLTPMVAQSSDDASLNSIETLPLCGVELSVLLEPPLEPPPPHAASSAAATLTDNSREDVGNITKNSCS